MSTPWWPTTRHAPPVSKYFAAIVARDLESTTARFNCLHCAIRWAAARIMSWDADGWTLGTTGSYDVWFRKGDAERVLIQTRSHSGRALLEREAGTTNER